ncbi:MAG TPA: hypothetical protein DIS82_13475 [Exiguobacterium sp.]|uniref:NACHT domain-containing protein n=1 Tax=Exiguobacterium sp. TaxID=44751 RepID=UPI000EDE6464|nr:NACHT domain-containing protein [Exiguobacterium sp.]HCN59161.1 hypothetical protein [Exiguobacterium sp.]
MELNEVITSINPYLSTLIETWIKPKLEKKIADSKEEKQKYTEFENAIKEFIHRSFKKNINLNTIVFRTQPKEIFELYVPLNIVSEKKEINVDNYPKEFLEELRKVIIVDSAGMGKSTLLKWMFINCLTHNRGIPIFIELRRLNSENTVINELTKELSSLKYKVTEELLYDLINQGDFIFFFDGYDEIPLNDKSEVTTDIQDFISKAHNNIFLLSSRDQASLDSFKDFFKFQIKPLEKEEAFELIKKYDGYGDLSDNLINTINQDNNYEDLKEFLTNPLMVSLLYKGFNHKQVIPLKKNLFYRQVYDALFEDHDLTKGGAYVHEKLSGLDSDDFHLVLKYFAFNSLEEGTIEYSKDKILQLLTISKKQTKIDFQIKKFLEDLLSSVPLFYKEGNLYRWKHKSLQEYFVAQFICFDSKEYQKAILTTLYNSKEFDRYINIFDLIYDSDFKSFRNYLITDFLNEAVLVNDLVEKQNELNKIQKHLLKNILLWKSHFIVTHNENLDFKNPSALITHEIFEKIQIYHKENKNQYRLTSMRTYPEKRISIARSYKWKYKFIDILYKKNLDIFTFTPRKRDKEVAQEAILKLSLSNNEKINLTLFDHKNAINNFDNVSENDSFTQLLLELNESVTPTIKSEKTKDKGDHNYLSLDFKKIKRMKKQIDDDNNEENKLEDFISFLKINDAD